MNPERNDRTLGLYVHFPFCRRRCPYCHFVTYPQSDHSAGDHVALLIRELALRSMPGFRIDSVYFGGGSPSLAGPEAVEDIINGIRRCYTLSDEAEITLEVNPEDVTGSSLREFGSVGINRLSIGVQSFNPEDLSCLGRIHHAAQGRRVIEAARHEGFDNVSVDLIIGLPSQTPTLLDRNLRVLSEERPDHVSCYLLEGYPEVEVEGDMAHDHYFRMRSGLLALGYSHYEVSNFSLPGRACRHNMGYWRNREYLAIGVSAAGFVNGVDYRNTASLRAYTTMLERNRLPENVLDAPVGRLRPIVMGLRLLDGISSEAFQGYENEVKALSEDGFLVERRGNIFVPPKHILLLNEILARFLP